MTATELKAADTGQLTALPRAESSPLAIFERLAQVEGRDVDKLGKLLEYDRQWRADRARDEYLAAMNRVAAKLPAVVKDKEGQKGRYARLETVHRAIKPVYTAEGFSITWTEGQTDKENHIRIVGKVLHKGGHSEEHFLDVAVDGTGPQGGKLAMNATQAVGSTISYGRRYLEVLIFDVTIADEDTDGNNNNRRITAEEAAEVEDLFEQMQNAAGRKFNLKRFIAAFGGDGCESILDFTLSQYEEAKADLIRQIRAAKKGGAN